MIELRESFSIDQDGLSNSNDIIIKRQN